MDLNPSPVVYEIFASYSHQDRRFVKPMIQYLKPTGASVFRDEDSIPPGKQWAAVIAQAIQGCRLLYLFWCRHSAASTEVQKEYLQAITLNKDIVPVLLDDTPLTDDLKPYQWVDLRAVIGQHEERVEQEIAPDGGEDYALVTRKKPAFAPSEYGLPGVDYGGDACDEAPIVRTVEIERDIPDQALRQAAVMLSAALEARVGNG